MYPYLGWYKFVHRRSLRIHKKTPIADNTFSKNLQDEKLAHKDQWHYYTATINMPRKASGK